MSRVKPDVPPQRSSAASRSAQESSQQDLIGLPRKLPHTSHAVDVGITLPVPVYDKTGSGAGNFVDSGLFETDRASWITAAMATQQTDFASRPGDVAPSVFGEIGDTLYNAWGQN